MAKITSIKPEEYGSYQWLLRETGKSLGLNPSPATWPHDQTQRIDSIVQSGVMQFYFCPPVQRDKEEDDTEERRDARMRQPHSWTFINQLNAFVIESGQSVYTLPEDFAGRNGDLTLDDGNGRIPVVAETHLRQISAKDNASGNPQYAAVRPKSSKGGGRQRWEVLLYPTPDASKVVNYRYTVAATDLSDENPFPLGGVAHAEAILASCLAVAEDRENPESNRARSLYQERLAASVHLDKQSGDPETTTWNSDIATDKARLEGLIGLHMGYGQNAKAWDETARQMILEAMRQGMGRFTVPPPIPGRRVGHKWSFLTPSAFLQVQSGQTQHDLPSDYGGMASIMTYAGTDNIDHPSVDIIGEHQIRKLLQSSTQANGRPAKAGVRQKSDVQDGGTGYEIIFWPVPNGNYTLEYSYRVQPSRDMSIIHGGDAHFQTILEAMKAAADVIQKRKQRPHEQLFMERLIASVHFDEQLAAPKQMGYNRDGSVRMGYDIFDDNRRFGHVETAVGYNGINY